MKQQQPLFSIIVPHYRRPERLGAFLHALVQLDYPRDRFEVVVVDDGSETPPETVVAYFHDRLDVVLLRQSHAGPATARNTGAARAKGKFLAFTDDDCAPAPDWLQALAARFTATPDRAIGGRTLNGLPDNLHSTASQMLIDYLYSYHDANPNQRCFFASSNLALSADRFHAVGGFDTTFPRAAGEDRELCDRWLYQGYRMTYAPEVRVYHTHALTFSTFWKQHFNYGRGAFHFHQLRTRRCQRGLRMEPLSFYLNMLRYPFLQVQGQQALLLAALLLVSQGANAAGFWWEKVNQMAGRPGDKGQKL
jgi:glycosyltransferase involved in cell wall biosynthesis